MLIGSPTKNAINDVINILLKYVFLLFIKLLKYIKDILTTHEYWNPKSYIKNGLITNNILIVKNNIFNVLNFKLKLLFNVNNIKNRDALNIDDVKPVKNI